MKTFTHKVALALIGPVAVLLLTSSCVSSKKYKALEAMKTACDKDLSDCRTTNGDLNAQIGQMDSNYASLQTRYDGLNGEYDRLSTQKKRLEEATSEALKNKQLELDEKETQLRERERRLRELQAIIDNQNKAVNDLKKTISDALIGYAPEELSIHVRDGKLYVSLAEQLLFPSGSDKVNTKGAEALKKLANVLSDNKEMNVMVEGHTDNVPISTTRFADNWDLSVHRATSIIRILTANGVEPGQIIASGRGEYFPVATNDTEAGKQSNRRTEIILSPKLDKLWELMRQ